MRVSFNMILHWVCNLKVKYRTFNPTKKERYLPDLPYRNALDPLYAATEWSSAYISFSVFLYGKYNGQVGEWLKPGDCKSPASGYVGSNPTLSTKI